MECWPAAAAVVLLMQVLLLLLLLLMQCNDRRPHASDLNFSKPPAAGGRNI
jgi:hypothetical protein